MTPRPPFTRGPVAVVLPAPGAAPARDRSRAADLGELLLRAADALEHELGGRPIPAGSSPPPGPRWELRFGGAEPAHHLDRRAGRLVTEAPTFDGLLDALSTLRELWGRPDGTWPVRDCADREELVARIRDAVRDAWPSFHVRDVDWDATCARHAPRVRAAADPIDAATRWVAELGDAHTAVRPVTPPGRLRYPIRVTAEAATFGEVDPGSPAGRAGVRAGHRLGGVDPIDLLARTGAPGHARAWVAGLLARQGPAGVPRAWSAAAPGSRPVSWTEAPVLPFDPPLLATGTVGRRGWLRIAAFAPDLGPALDAALDGPLRDVPELVVDLRGNGGGHLGTALRLRDRFVREPTVMGTLRATLPGGALGPEVQLRATPAERPFAGRVTFLVDEGTYSASEDLLLGLQGLPHVTVLGRATGGGSGRVRRVRLLPGWVLTVSTALTWDRRRRLVEGVGLPPDRADRGPLDTAAWCAGAG